MASFLDNKGDIILDAVLTDYGRRLLAKGDGSFNIVKFAFGDDEIDYSLFHATASTGLQDKDIMTTPILEAFTNNAASMKSQLITMGDNKLLFMSSLKLDQSDDNTKSGSFGVSENNVTFKGFVVPYDIDSTANANNASNNLTGSGLNSTALPGVLSNNRTIRIVQGIDSDRLNKTNALDMQLSEDEFDIFVDDRFCTIHLSYNSNAISKLSVDDDGIAVYKVSSADGFVKTIQDRESDKVFKGPVGNKLEFTIKPSDNLSSDAYFSKYGKKLFLNKDAATKQFNTIKMPLRVVGVKTGVSIEIPIMFAKIV